MGLIRGNKNTPVYFQTRFGIHTFFLRDKIEVLILSDNNQIVKKKILAPSRIFFWNPRYYKVVEIPKSSKHFKRFTLGEKVNLQYIN